MNEAQWVELIAERVRSTAVSHAASLEVRTGLRLAYGYEITAYRDVPDSQSSVFQTDLAVIEIAEDGSWKPRVVVEAKVRAVTTHDAITYSHKAATHKAVHPYLRYGIMLGNCKDHPLPGRLYRHGAQFDFMFSFTSFSPSETEMLSFSHLIQAEVEASRTLEEIIYESRKPGRAKYTMLHRMLLLRKE